MGLLKNKAIFTWNIFSENNLENNGSLQMEYLIFILISISCLI